MRFQVAIHYRQHIMHHAQGHKTIRRALMFRQRVDVAITTIGGFHAPQNVTGILAQIRIHKRGRLQLQGVHIAPL